MGNVAFTPKQKTEYNRGYSGIWQVGETLLVQCWEKNSLELLLLRALVFPCVTAVSNTPPRH